MQLYSKLLYIFYSYYIFFLMQLYSKCKKGKMELAHIFTSPPFFNAGDKKTMP